MSLVEHYDVPQALATNRSYQAFDVRVLPGRSCRRDYFFDAHVLDALAEERTVDGVPITDHESWGKILGKSLDDLLSRPLGRGIRRDVEVDDLPALVTQHDKGKEYAERSGRNGKEVNRDDVTNMVVQKGAPSL